MPASPHARVYLDLLAQIIEPLATTLGPQCEIVLHDLSNLDRSVHAIAGALTGRAVGSPATDLLLQQLSRGGREHSLNYATTLPDMRQARSSTIMINDPGTGEPIAALCLNIDVSELQLARHLLDSMVGLRHRAMNGELADEAGEAFPSTVAELTERLIADAITEVDVPAHLMKKAHKLQVVAILDRQGVFHVKEAVEDVANALSVTRFTIYNYLNELGGSNEAQEEAS